METIEQPPVEVKTKKKSKKKKSAKLNNNHQTCEDEEKILENGVSNEKIIENLSNDIDGLHIVKHKNGLKLVNGTHDEENRRSQSDNTEIKQKVNREETTAIVENNNSTGTTSKKCAKKKKNKKQNAKGPDKIETNSDQVPTELVGTNTNESVIANGSVEASGKETSTDNVQSLSQDVSTNPIIVDVIPKNEPKIVIEYKEYESELQMPDIMQLIQKDLSEPYSIYTYRYFIHNWPKLCFLAMDQTKCVGAIVCKLDMHKMVRRGYIAMLAVDKDYRKMKIGTTLVQKAIEAMLRDKADEVVLETEITNQPALRLYENLGFVRDKRLFHYYLNGVDALRLKLWFR